MVNNKKVPDTLFSNIASQDKYRAKLYAMLEKIHRKDLFPARYKNQEDIARSILLNDKSYKEFADLKLVSKEMMQVKGDKGLVYLFKYKINKDDDWKMGISGLQPVNSSEVNSSEKLVRLTDKKLKASEPVNEQFEQQLKRLLFSQHKGGRQFFDGSSINMFSEMFEDQQ